MRKNIAFVVFLSQALWTLPGALNARAAEGLDTKLRALVHNHQIQAKNFIEALTGLASEFQIPMGIEWVNTPASKVKLTLSWEDATVLQILKEIAKTQPGYQMAVKNGVVHVYPPHLVPDRQNFLRLTLNEFEVDRQPVESALRKLRDQVKLTVSPPKPRKGPGGTAGTGFSNAGEPEVSLRLKNVTLVDVLDALVIASARKIWIVTFLDTPNVTATGFRRTISFWNQGDIPDSEQPVLDMFHWNSTIPQIARMPLSHLGITRPQGAHVSSSNFGYWFNTEL